MARRSPPKPAPLPDLEPGRKHGRLGLYLPFFIALVVIIAWSGFWLYARSQTRTQMDATVEAMKRAGYEVSWKERRITGYPFRINVWLTDARIREPSGWALESPDLEGQAYMHALSLWTLAAPQGLTFVRPIGGPVRMQGEVIVASLSHLDNYPPNFSFQGTKLTFTPTAGAQPFPLSAADKVELHLRAGGTNEAAVMFKVDNGKARLSGLFQRIAGDKPISMVWDTTLSKISAFQGENWPDAVRSWAAAGGQATVRQAGITAGEALIGAQSGTLTVGYDGRLRGSMEVTLRQAPRALTAMGETGVIPQGSAEAAAAVAQARQDQGDLARATLNFEAGQTTLGPVAIGPAPRVY
jgi:hypothetical protein